ncbi:MAG: lytic transglycosylase domain-containing protein [Pseudobdellovibrionaceae bacterium]
MTTTLNFFDTPQFKKFGVLSALALTALFYQNFSFSNAWRLDLQTLNEKSRAAHAKELLGKTYQNSPARLVEGSPMLGMAILNEVYRSLPAAHKEAAIDLSSTLLQQAEKYHFDPVFVMAVIRTESSFNPMARGQHGEIGLMQLKPKTAKWIAEKFKLPWYGAKTLEDPSMNVRIGVAYMNYLRGRFNKQAEKYISAYNMGYTKATQMYASETKPQIYSQKVLKNYRDAYRRLAAASVAVPLIIASNH